MEAMVLLLVWMPACAAVSCRVLPVMPELLCSLSAEFSGITTDLFKGGWGGWGGGGRGACFWHGSEARIQWACVFSNDATGMQMPQTLLVIQPRMLAFWDRLACLSVFNEYNTFVPVMSDAAFLMNVSALTASSSSRYSIAILIFFSSLYSASTIRIPACNFARCGTIPKAYHP